LGCGRNRTPFFDIGRLPSGNTKPKVLFHGIEVAILMEERVTALDAVGGDDDVYRLADRNTLAAERSIVASRPNREVIIEKRNDRITAEIALDVCRMGFIAGTLKHFQQDEIPDQQRLA
jgi:hypothetical protein